MIYCIEEDDKLRDIIGYMLREHGFETKTFKTGHELFGELSKRKPQMVIADVMCEDEDGSALLAHLRESVHDMHVPILIITTKWQGCNRICGIDIETDYCLFKPFSGKELIKVVDEIVRSGSKGDTRVLHMGCITYSPAENRVQVNDAHIQLTHKEYALLYIMMDNPGEVFTRAQLFDSIWQSDYLGETRTVDVHVGTLRTKLGEGGKYIRTKRGHGYYMSECE